MTFPVIGENKKTSIQIIDLTKLPKNDQQIKMSSFASEIRYISLESNDNIIIEGGPKFFVYDSLIVVRAHRQIMVFDAKEGRFIRKIGDFGHGPNEFMNSHNSYLKDGKIIISALGWDFEYIEYTIDGKIVNKIKTFNHPREIAWLTDELYAFSYIKQSNSDSVLLQVYDSKGLKVKTTFKDDRKFKNTNRFTYYGANFHRYNNQLFTKDCFNDTVFRITERKMIPVFVFNSGRFSPPYNEKEVLDFTEYHYISEIIESDNYLFFVLQFKKLSYFCYYDKRVRRVFVLSGLQAENVGYENDIDGFVPFRPQTLNENNELVGYVYPYQIKKWFDENPDKAAKLSPELKKLRTINDNDNPVLMLVKLKE